VRLQQLLQPAAATSADLPTGPAGAGAWLALLTIEPRLAATAAAAAAAADRLAAALAANLHAATAAAPIFPIRAPRDAAAARGCGGGGGRCRPPARGRRPGRGRGAEGGGLWCPADGFWEVLPPAPSDIGDNDDDDNDAAVAAAAAAGDTAPARRTSCLLCGADVGLPRTWALWRARMAAPIAYVVLGFVFAVVPL